MNFGIEDKINNTINGVPEAEILKEIEKYLNERGMINNDMHI